MVEYKIQPEKTALIVFDMINSFIAEGSPFETFGAREELVPKLKKLLKACRLKKIQVIYTNEALRADGSDAGRLADIWPPIKEGKVLIKGTKEVEVYGEIKPEEGDIVIEKHRYSAFHATDLDLILRNKGIDTLIICGVSSIIGVETTARDAFVRDYKVIFPSDGSMCDDLPDLGWGPVSRQEIQKVLLTTMAKAVAHVVSIDEIIAKF